MNKTSSQIACGIVILFGCSANTDTEYAGGSDGVEIAEPRKWTWVPVGGTRCLDGSSTGFGFSMGHVPETSDPDRNTPIKLLVYMDGGGACFNSTSCAALDIAMASVEEHLLNTFIGFSGQEMPRFYGPEDLAWHANWRLQTGLFNRELTENPFADWHFVYMPYCSGDAFAGDKVRTTAATDMAGSSLTHKGYTNVQRFIDTIGATLEEQNWNVEHLVVAGGSAGGIGAMVHAPYFKEEIDPDRFDLLNMSGSVLSDEYLKPCLQDRWNYAWNLGNNLRQSYPEWEGWTEDALGNVEHIVGLENLFDHTLAESGVDNFAYVSTAYDWVMAFFLGRTPVGSCGAEQRPLPNLSKFREGVAKTHQRLTETNSDKYRGYFVRNHQHLMNIEATCFVHEGVEGIVQTDTEPLSLYTWLDQMVQADSEWQSLGEDNLEYSEAWPWTEATKEITADCSK